MDINAVFPSKYLRAADLQGRDCRVVMDYVEIEDLGGGEVEDIKPVLFFKGKKKGLVVNKTNANTIAGMYGPDTDNWNDQIITLFPTQTEFGAKTVPCIRVRLQNAAQMPTRAEMPQPDPEPPRREIEHAQLSEEDIPF